MVPGDPIWYRSLRNDNKANDYHLVSERIPNSTLPGVTCHPTTAGAEGTASFRRSI